MDPASLGLVAALSIVSTVLAVRQFYLVRELQRSTRDLAEAKRNQQATPSLELTEFLRDQAQYGYSFTRVDPGNVMITMPRGGR